MNLLPKENLEDLKPNKTNQQKIYGVAKETYDIVNGIKKFRGLTVISHKPMTEAAARRYANINPNEFLVVNLMGV
jgi:hypothetical protein